jgi:purine-nucleoside phosphorylase
MNDLLARIDTCADYLRNTLETVPDRAIILGSGLGALTERMSERQVINYTDIPGFPRPTVVGHRGELVLGKLNGVAVMALAGRFHYYEGHPLDTVVLPARVFARLGVKTLMITNAAGGVNTNFAAGDLMLITDHLNLTGKNPLMGDNLDEFGTRFPDMSYVYTPALQVLARRVAKKNGLTLREGVYAWMSGPSYETPAEVRMLRVLGADAVGMSTAPEAIAAAHSGMQVVGVSLITNMAAGVLNQALTHAEVTAAADEAAPRFETLATGILSGI